MLPILLKKLIFRNSALYWDRRYKRGGNSGQGSYHEFAEFKARVINDFVLNQKIESVIEFGCGDGNQLSQMVYPVYTGFDVSQVAIEKCRQKYNCKTDWCFYPLEEYNSGKAQLGLSLDVIYHLVEQVVFDKHLYTLFHAATDYVIIFSSNTDNNPEPRLPHVFHRRFEEYIEVLFPEWTLEKKINKTVVGTREPGDGHADFYIYSNNRNQ